MSGKKVLLIDGNGLIYRAFYATDLLTTSSGQPVNAVYSFTNMLIKILKEQNNDYLAITFDKDGARYRKEIYPQYKAHREKMPEDLICQLCLIRRVISSLNIPVFEYEGYEADDCLATITKLGQKKNFQVSILTGDHDLLQLVSPQTTVLLTQKGTSAMDVYDLLKVQEKYGLEAEKFLDLKALVGDKSDNIPGVPGIGQKTAVTLLKEYGTLENIFANTEKISSAKISCLLANYKNQAFLSKKLAALQEDLPLEVNWDKLSTKNINLSNLKDLLIELEFKSILEKLDLKDSPKEITILPQIIEGLEAWQNLIKMIDEKGSFAFVIDLTDETLLEAEILGISFALSDSETFYLPLGFTFGPHLPESDVYQGLSEIFASSTKKIAHDSKSACKILKQKNIAYSPFSFDTKSASYLLDPEKKHSLEEIARRTLQLNLPSFKSKKERDLLDINEAAIVSASRAGVIYRLVAPLKAELAKINLSLAEEINFSEVLAEMELDGIGLDLEYLSKLSKKLKGFICSLEEEIFCLTGEKFNLNSPLQLGNILFNKLNIPGGIKTKKGSYQTGVDALLPLASSYPVAEKILQYREYTKLKNTYADALPALVDPKTGRLHTCFDQTGTATGRLSSSEPNLQNIPTRSELGREIRQSFIPRVKGGLFLSADYSQIELRVLAHFTKADGLISAFSSGQDIHTFTAMKIFSLSDASLVTSQMRRLAKIVNFGILYGMSDFGLAKNLGIKREEAKEYIKAYYENFQGVREWIDELIAEAEKKGYTETITKRRRYFPDLLSHNKNIRDSARRMAINAPIQGSAADIIKIAMLNISREIKKQKLSMKMILQIHDELVFDITDRELEYSAMVKNLMETAFPLAVPLRVDLKVGENLGNMSKASSFT